MSKTLTAFIVFSLTAFAAPADTLEFQDGTKMEGVYVNDLGGDILYAADPETAKVTPLRRDSVVWTKSEDRENIRAAWADARTKVSEPRKEFVKPPEENSPQEPVTIRGTATADKRRAANARYAAPLPEGFVPVEERDAAMRASMISGALQREGQHHRVIETVHVQRQQAAIEANTPPVISQPLTDAAAHRRKMDELIEAIKDTKP